MSTLGSRGNDRSVGAALVAATLGAIAIAWWAENDRNATDGDAAVGAGTRANGTEDVDVESPGVGTGGAATQENARGSAPPGEPNFDEVAWDAGGAVDGGLDVESRGAATERNLPPDTTAAPATTPEPRSPRKHGAAPRQLGARDQAPSPVRARPIDATGQPVPDEAAPPRSPGTGPLRPPPGPDPLPIRR